MHRIIGLVLILALVLVAANATAQTAGQHRGIFVGTSNWLVGTTVNSAVGLFDTKNTFQTWPTSASGPWPHWGMMWGAAQDTDNQGVLLYYLNGWVVTITGNPPTTIINPISQGVVRFEPLLPGITSTLWSAPAATAFPANMTDFTVDSDGDLVSYDTNPNNPSMEQAVRFDRFNNRWVGTTLSVRSSMAANGGLGGLRWDKRKGGFWMSSARHTIGTTLQTLVRFSWDMSSSTLVATGGSPISANLGGCLLENGDWVSSSYTGYFYHEVKSGSSLWTSGPLSSSWVNLDVGAEKYAAAGRGYYAALVDRTTGNHTIGYFDATTTPHTLTTLAAGVALPGVGSGFLAEALPLYNQDLVTQRTGKGTWDILVNPDPLGSQFLQGKDYLIVASLSGAMPIKLPSGRQLFITPDQLTLLTVNGPLPPFFTGSVGKLSPFGKAAAKLNLAALGTNANGVVINFAGAIFDSTAPDGIAWVLEPCALVIEVLP